ncbi:MAG: helix-turn-helix transcriptional regulator [Oscillibacter sp.]|nr:helix-turn-helix transcriptional regulator [Oscillibacter sp.]
MRLKKLGKTQKWLALQTGLSKNCICNIINGKAVPSPLTLKKIACVAELDESELFNVLF